MIGDSGSTDRHVGDLGRLHGFKQVGERLGATKKRRAFAVFHIRSRRIVQRDAPEAIALTQQYGTEGSLADARGILQHRLEDGLQLAGRGADDA